MRWETRFTTSYAIELHKTQVIAKMYGHQAKTHTRGSKVGAAYPKPASQPARHTEPKVYCTSTQCVPRLPNGVYHMQSFSFASACDHASVLQPLYIYHTLPHAERGAQLFGFLNLLLRNPLAIAYPRPTQGSSKHADPPSQQISSNSYFGLVL